MTHILFKIKVKIEGSTENKKISLMSKLQNTFKNYHNQKYIPFGSQKFKTTPKSRQNQMPELKENKKTKVVVLMSRPQNISLQSPNPKNSPFGPKNAKKQPVN